MNFSVAYEFYRDDVVILRNDWILNNNGKTIIEENATVFSYYSSDLKKSIDTKMLSRKDYLRKIEGDGIYKFVIHSLHGNNLIFKEHLQMKLKFRIKIKKIIIWDAFILKNLFLREFQN